MDGMSALWSYLCLRCHWSRLLYMPSISFSPPALSLLLIVFLLPSFHQFLCASLCLCFHLFLVPLPPVCISCSICVCLSGRDQGVAYCCTGKYEKRRRKRSRRLQERKTEELKKKLRNWKGCITDRIRSQEKLCGREEWVKEMDWDDERAEISKSQTDVSLFTIQQENSLTAERAFTALSRHAQSDRWWVCVWQCMFYFSAQGWVTDKTLLSAIASYADMPHTCWNLPPKTTSDRFVPLSPRIRAHPHLRCITNRSFPLGMSRPIMTQFGFLMSFFPKVQS